MAFPFMAHCQHEDRVNGQRGCPEPAYPSAAYPQNFTSGLYPNSVAVAGEANLGDAVTVTFAANVFTVWRNGIDLGSPTTAADWATMRLMLIMGIDAGVIVCPPTARAIFQSPLQWVRYTTGAEARTGGGSTKYLGNYAVLFMADRMPSSSELDQMPKRAPNMIEDRTEDFWGLKLKAIQNPTTPLPIRPARSASVTPPRRNVLLLHKSSEPKFEDESTQSETESEEEHDARAMQRNGTTSKNRASDVKHNAPKRRKT